MRATTLLAVGALFSFCGSCCANLFIWQKNTNFDDPNNWSGGGVICKNDRKVYPADMFASVFIQRNESLQELVLSNNMVLTIGEGAVLSFSKDPVAVSSKQPQTGQVSQISRDPDVKKDDSSKSCVAKGRVLNFIAGSSSWFDPSSWNRTVSATNDSKRFLLDWQRVPCQKDNVEFPSANTFQVNMEQQPIRVSSLSIRDQSIESQPAFNKYLSSEKYKYDFRNRSDSNSVSASDCTDDKSCDCSGQITDTLMSLVCKYRKNVVDPATRCKNPVKPTRGHCNSLCGAKVTLKRNATGSSDDVYAFADKIEAELGKALAKWPTVMYALENLPSGDLEVILKDNGTGSDASESVCAFETYWNASVYAVDTSFVFERSDGIDNCYVPIKFKQIQSRKFNYLILGVALAIGVICIVLVIAGIALYRRRYQANLKQKDEMELGNRMSTQGFDNPVYDTPLPYDDNFVITYETDNDQIHGFSNPMVTSSSDMTDSSGVVERKSPPPDYDEYAKIDKKSKKKAGKKSKGSKNLGFDNPVYDIKDQDKTDSMVSVSLDEDDVDIPQSVEYDGEGFVNPIATGLSESMMVQSIEEPKPVGPVKKKASVKPSNGFENPLYKEPDHEPRVDDGTDNDVTTVHVATATKKKKKKEKKGKKYSQFPEDEIDNGDLGFGNPVYDMDNSSDLYQPSIPGMDDQDSE